MGRFQRGTVSCKGAKEGLRHSKKRRGELEQEDQKLFKWPGENKLRKKVMPTRSARREENGKEGLAKSE